MADCHDPAIEDCKGEEKELKEGQYFRLFDGKDNKSRTSFYLLLFPLTKKVTKKSRRPNSPPASPTRPSVARHSQRFTIFSKNLFFKERLLMF